MAPDYSYPNLIKICEAAINVNVDDSSVLVKQISLIQITFKEVFARKLMYLEVDISSLPNPTKAERERIDLQNKLSDVHKWLGSLLSAQDKSVQETAFNTLFSLLSYQIEHPIKKTVQFPYQILQKIIIVFVSLPASTFLRITGRFRKKMSHDDLRFLTMKVILDFIRDMEDGVFSNISKSLFGILKCISGSMGESSDGGLSNFFGKQPSADSGEKMLRYKEHRRLFSSVWLEFLKHSLVPNLYKQVLLLLADDVIPHMIDPCQLHDFLNSAYAFGGIVGILALHGVFLLMHKHNLEYSNFYSNVYALLQPSVLHAKYRARFFHLMDIFLSSSHISAALVAGFLKRIARLAFLAPCSSLPLIIHFSLNLLRRHPACLVMVNAPSQPEDTTTDPYDPDQPDPALSNALSSSLWELKALQHHFNPDVASWAGVINSPFGSMETDISKFMDYSGDSLVDKAFARKKSTSQENTHPPLAYEHPKANLFGVSNDKMLTCWEWS